MEKLLFTVIAGAVVATALLLAGLCIQDLASPGSISAAQRSNAINIALSDDYVRQYLSTADNHTIGSVMPVPDDFYSYSGNTTRILVPVTVQNPYFNNTLTVTVDLDENRTVTIFETPAGTMYDPVGPEAIKVVLGDPTIHEMVNNSGYSISYDNRTTYYKNVYIVHNPVPHENGDYGLLNDSTSYEDVSVQVGEMAPIFSTVTATVDTSSGKVIMAKYQDAEMIHPSYYAVTLKPGAAFYTRYSGFANHSFANYSAGTEGLSTIDEAPGTAIPRPEIVDCDNFDKLQNGTAYQPMGISLSITDKGWQASVPKGTDFYLVLRNNDSMSDSTLSLSPHAIFI